MREAEAKARENAAKSTQGRAGRQNQGKEVEIDFDIKNTGQTKTDQRLRYAPGDRDDYRS